MIVRQEHETGQDRTHALHGGAHERQSRVLQFQELAGRRGFDQRHLRMFSGVQVEAEPGREQAIAAIRQAGHQTAKLAEQEKVGGMAVERDDRIVASQRQLELEREQEGQRQGNLSETNR